MTTDETVEIKGEFVILLEDAALTEDVEQRFEEACSQMQEVAQNYGFKFRASGTEKKMRLMLVDRAKFIAEVVKGE